MAIIATMPEGNFKKVNPGNYVARCYKMIEIGTVETNYNGEVKKVKQVQLTWELPNELEKFHEEKGYEPYVVSKTYTLSMHEKSKLRQDLESWRGKGFTELEAAKFDVTKLLGVPCMLNVIHRPGKTDPSKTYVEVSSITPLPKGVSCPAPLNNSTSLSYDSWDQSVFDSLSENLKAKIQSSDEYKQMNAGTTEAVEMTDITDDLPF